MEKTTKSAEETKKIAQEVLKTLKLPAVLALYGDLGSGKTTFVQGLASSLGVQQHVLSPTFIVERIYSLPDNKKLHHLDLYRLEKEADAKFLDLDELFSDPNALIIIEWPDKIENLLPTRTLKIHFSHLAGDKRKISW